MKGLQAACPACGGPVKFEISTSLVTVCPSCRSVVARGDKKLEDLGKVADLAETGSPLKVGLAGQYQGKRFRLVGRAQYKHAAGGVWDEWYAAFPANRWGWLAEAQGRFYLTFECQPSQMAPLPPFDALEIEVRLKLGGNQEFTVAEVGRATTLSAEGEIPYRFEPDQPLDYADLYGLDGAFATLDYTGDEPALYLGSEVTLDELGISAAARGQDRETPRISALQIACPQCGGPLTLVAPDKTERVACPNCHSLLDANQGKLKYLQTLQPGEHQPLLPLGKTGTICGVEYAVIGFMARSVTIDEEDYFWTEYLLYHTREGFRWLVNSDRHWNFVRPVSAGAVRASPVMARYGGRDFRIFQRATATVRHVLGEFYWKVTVGERVDCADYVAPPDMLSEEVSRPTTEAEQRARPTAREVNFSLGTYVPHAEIEQAFGVSNLPRGFGVAPNQPAPIDGRVYLSWAGFVVVLILLDMAFTTSLSKEVDQGMFAVCLLAVSVLPLGAAVYAWGFEKARWADSEFSPYGSTEGNDDEDE
jgi:uncharacterized Zn finger protein (UPF0148 family)